MPILFFILALAGSAAAVTFWPKPTHKNGNDVAQKNLEKAHQEAKEIVDEAKDKAARLKRALIEEEKHSEETAAHAEVRVKNKEEILKKREERNTQIQVQSEAIQKEIEATSGAQRDLHKKALEQLSKLSGLNLESATEEIKEDLQKLIVEGREARLQAELEEWAEDIGRHAKAVLQIVIQRLGVPSSVDKNNTLVMVPDDSFKGLLVGKEGRNIEYLESKLPVFVIFNHGGDPTVLYVTGLNLLRRNIAKRAIEKMQKWVKKTGLIDHPLIDRALEEAEGEIMKECDQWGEKAMREMHIDPATVDPEVKNYVGRLYFRTSYGQNIIRHSLEMAHAARLIAELVGSNVQFAELGAFYHDLGKAIDHDVGGSHDDLSKELLDKHGFAPQIAHAAFAHHDKVPCETPEDFIVKAVDAISGGRPGARMESVTNYFERMQELSGVAESFPGVDRVFTMSAGREVRVLVYKEQVSDAQMGELAEGIAKKISEDIAFPGIIKVNLIRSIKSVDFAREQKTRK